MMLTPFFVVLAVLAQRQLCRAGDPCPPPEQLQFCTCTLQENLNQSPSQVTENTTVNIGKNLPNASVLTVIDCNATSTITALEEAIAVGLHRRNIDKLTVHHVPAEKEHALARLPDQWLKNTRVKHLELLDSKLSGDFMWEGNPFAGQEESLLILTVNNCSLYGALTHDTIGTANTKKLDLLPSVEILDFSYNLLTVVTSSAFHKPSANLSTIVLSRNSIENVESGAFKNVLNLKSIDLSHNMLDSVARGIFASTPRSLETINLGWNFLKVLPDDFFTHMPALKSVILEKNFIYSMPEKPWNTVWSQLNIVNIEGNFINCDCNLLWLTRNATTPSKKVLKGKCYYHRLPVIQGIEHSLDNLKRDSLICNN